MITAADAIICAGLGYLFYFCDKKENYNLSRQTGHKLYLHFLVRGASFYMPSWLLAVSWLQTKPSTLGHFGFTFIGAVSLVFIQVAWRSIFGPDDQTLAIQAYKQSGDDLDYICAMAIEDEAPVQVILSNGKSYFGYIGRTVEPNKENSYLSIIPMGSGFRGGDGILRVTHWYTQILDVIEGSADDEPSEAPDLNRYLMAIPRSEIITCHIFDFEIYEDIQAQLDAAEEGDTDES